MLNVKYLANSGYLLIGFMHFNFLLLCFLDVSVKYYLCAF